MAKECIKQNLANKPLPKLFKEQVQSFIAFRKRPLKPVIVALEFTALFSGKTKQHDSKRNGQCDSNLAIFETETEQELDTSISKIKAIKDICDLF